jgi:hypothetical protein
MVAATAEGRNSREALTALMLARCSMTRAQQYRSSEVLSS